LILINEKIKNAKVSLKNKKKHWFLYKLKLITKIGEK